MKEQWQRTRESASYIDIGVPIPHPPAWANAKPGEVCHMPVCRVHRHVGCDERVALIKAAPDMLEALRNLVKALKWEPPSLIDESTEIEWPPLDELISEAEAIIKKATSV